MPHAKMYDFVSFPLFGFTLVIKLRNFDFKIHVVSDLSTSHGKMSDFISFPLFLFTEKYQF